jgi:predicted nucleotidyltransferase
VLVESRLQIYNHRLRELTMKSAANKKQILKELKNLLKEEFSDYIDKVILFGSQASNTAHEYSDYDILVVLKKDYDWHLEDAILNLCYEIDLKYDILTDVQLIGVPKQTMPIMLNLTKKKWQQCTMR